ncbi:hypothetical protein, partial [Paenibacillus sp. oral taxon 786]|uniref:hypothetical protein n=1 Tax=Paenibacillus sp. oral taxon 786 TaxID=652715 RepID=UPI00055C3CA9
MMDLLLFSIVELVEQLLRGQLALLPQLLCIGKRCSDRVMKLGAQAGYGSIPPVMDAIGQQDAGQLPLGIDVEAGAGEPGVAVG